MTTEDYDKLLADLEAQRANVQSIMDKLLQRTKEKYDTFGLTVVYNELYDSFFKMGYDVGRSAHGALNIMRQAGIDVSSYEPKP
jgi:hypothetical protein